MVAEEVVRVVPPDGLDVAVVDDPVLQGGRGAARTNLGVKPGSARLAMIKVLNHSKASLRPQTFSLKGSWLLVSSLKSASASDH
ncbi:MAG: hypothetical protein M3378_00805 [Actinomycetota bacterium]|nr:hypothetical protein [Actinomycetota bacterium]